MASIISVLSLFNDNNCANGRDSTLCFDPLTSKISLFFFDTEIRRNEIILILIITVYLCDTLNVMRLRNIREF